MADPKNANDGKVLINFTHKRLLVFHRPQSGSMLSQLSGANATLTPEEALAESQLADAIHIIPGLHAYPASHWDAMKDHPQIKALVADGAIVLQTKGGLGQKLKEGENDQTPAAALPGSLERLDAGKAKDLVSGVMDAQLLERWLEAENVGSKRSSVLDQLKDQLARIKEMDAKLAASRSTVQN